MRVNRQILAALLCNLGGCSAGMLVGWLSPAMPQLLADSRPVGDISLEQSAWLAAIFPLPGFLSPLFVKMSEVYGRKKCIIITSLPFAINGVLILLARDVTVLIIGRAVAGFGVAMALSNGPAYIAEIADVEARGRMASTFNIMYTMGITTVYVFGGFVSYRAAALAMIAVAVANFVLFIFMPESPLHLVRCGRKEEATKSIAWLKRADPKGELVNAELKHIEETLSVEKMTMLQALKLLFSSRPLAYGCGVCLVMFFGQAMTGMFAVHGYSVTIFMDGGTSAITPEMAAFLYACIQVSGALSTSWLVDRLGRKILVLTSFIGVSICMFVMGTYFYMKSFGNDVTSYHWVTVLALCSCVYLYTIGAGGVPFILMADLLNDQVRSVSTIFVLQMMSAMGFLLLRFFEPISVSYGRHVIFYFFSGCCLVTATFAIFFLNETKGKTQHDIMDMHYGFKGKLKIGEKCEKSEILE